MLSDVTWLPADATAPRLARQFVLDFCNRHGVGVRVTADAVEVAAELVTNAVQHGHTSARLGLAWDPPWLTVEVVDGAPDLLPEPARGAEDEEGGRGLLVVGRLADRLSWTTTDRQKAVRAVLRAPVPGELRVR